MITEYRILEVLDEIKEQLIIQRSDEWLTTTEAVKYCHVSASTLNRAIQNGVLKVSKATGRNLFKRSWLDRWLVG